MMDQLFCMCSYFELDYTRPLVVFFILSTKLKALFIDDFQFVYQCNFRQGRGEL